jgi:glycogen debranching enzyme
MMGEAARKAEQTVPERVGEANVWSEYEIEAQTSLVDRPLRNLKHADAFAVLDAHGDIGAIKDTAEGLFYRDTRYLSQFELRIEGRTPLFLGSVALADKPALAVDLTNPDIQIGENDRLPRDTIFLERMKFLWKAVCYERVSVRNFGTVPRRVRLDFVFGTDFRDLFEVRGTPRIRRGRDLPPLISRDKVSLRYVGLDDIERRAVLCFSPSPKRLDARLATIEFNLAPGQSDSVFVTVSCEEDKPNEIGDFFLSYRDARRARRASTAGIATVTSSSEIFDEVVARAASDVYTLVTRTDQGPYPYAGIPWFNTIFGRDGIITAMLMLWVDPSIARGVLRILAQTQATKLDSRADSQPGKILHEIRHGEMANLGEVPFGRYYGSVDSTPLFLMLAGQYFERTGDTDTLKEIWPKIEAALSWVDAYGDLDGDGFVEYARESDAGLINQGWKDSFDAIFHADGSGARGPIALCEVQGYVFAAKRGIADVAMALGYSELGIRLAREADAIREKFDAAFWCEEIGTYALALDGDKRRCAVRASNAGHALFTGIADASRARSVADALMSRESFSGWGVRTIAQGEARYNPMSYHNGSVWPHDNGMIAIGLARYGLKREAARIFTGLFNYATEQELQRFPELFCGFIRRPHRGPTAYPVACSPQSWSAATPFGLLAACLGLELAHAQDEIRFRDPVMPDFLEEVSIRNLRLGHSHLDVRLHRYGRDVTVNVVSRQGPARVLLLK